MKKIVNLSCTFQIFNLMSQLHLSPSKLVEIFVSVDDFLGSSDILAIIEKKLKFCF